MTYPLSSAGDAVAGCFEPHARSLAPGALKEAVIQTLRIGDNVVEVVTVEGCS